MATIHEIAKRAGVSIGTVDRVLHNRGRVKEDTKLKIEKAMDDLGYKPNKVAQGLAVRKKKLKFLFMITKTKYNPFFKDVKESAVKKAKELEAFGVKTDIITYPENADEEKVLMEKLKKKIGDYDGACIMSRVSKINKLILDRSKKDKMPVVYYNTRDDKNSAFSYVGCDYVAAGKMAAGLCALLAGKDANVCIFSEENDIKESHVKRLEGFKEEIKEKYPTMNILAEYNITGDRQKDKKSVDDMMKLNGENKIVYIINPRDYGICKIIGMKDKERKIPIITNDLVEFQYELFEKGIISATICQEPEKQGDMPLGILFDYFAYGKKPEPVNYTKLEIKISQSLYTS